MAASVAALSTLARANSLDQAPPLNEFHGSAKQKNPKADAPDSVTATDFVDEVDFVVASNFVYSIGASGIVISVPRGFVTDFASIPKALWSLGLAPHGRYGRAAVIHDYLYWTQGCSREQADNLLMIAMKESQVEAVTRDAIYRGVRIGGQGAWAQNAAQRAMGATRFVPAASMNFGALMSWPELRAQLAAKGVKDPPMPAARYCKLGDSTDVPMAAVAHR
jgi:hypothetical protein